MSDLNNAFKSIFDEVEEVKYGMTFAEAEADAEANKLSQRQLDDLYSDEYDAGFNDAYNLDSCVPMSDLRVGREAYLEGYAVGIAAWNQIEYPDINHLGN